MPSAFDRNDLRVGKKLGAVATHGFHEIALGAIDKQDGTLEPPNESFDLSFGHRRGGSVTQDRIVLPTIASALEAGAVARRVQGRPVGNQRKRLLQRLRGGIERLVWKRNLDVVPALQTLGDNVRD